jgi:ABC-type bacteriocin/lantibiotic exporter with double-glycine peptidase domain
MKRYNITRVLSQLIGELHIPITRQSIEEEIALHPNYNSLLAISDILNNWGVPNASYQLDFKELIESEVPVPFVAYLANQEFALVSNLDERYEVV